MKILFDDNRLEEFKDEDPFIVMQKLCDIYQEFYSEIQKKGKFEIEDYNISLHSYAFLLAFARKWDFSVKALSVGGNRKGNLDNILSLVHELKDQAEKKYTEKIVGIASEKYDVLFGNEFYYEINDNDYQRIQELLNELRNLIRESEEVPEEQKNRLLKRLEQLQTELDKRVSNFDRFWGVAVEISGNLGKICENVKPFNDRLKELLDIVAKIMKIGTGTILLESGDEPNLIEPPQ